MEEKTIEEFKRAFEDYNKALQYINNNEAILKQDVKKWSNIQINFKNKFEKKLDEAFKNLPEYAEKRFYTRYYMLRFRDSEDVKDIKKMAKFWDNGKVLSIAC